MEIDKKAKKILFDTYWQNGWVDNPTTPVDDFEYAKSKGLMFDRFSIDHDICITQIQEYRQQITPKMAAKAFLNSLSSRRLYLRSGIASYHIACKLPVHTYTPIVSGHGYKDGKITSTSYTCKICRDAQYGIIGNESYNNRDLNVLNFERIKWGGVRHGDILYTLFDLKQFLKEEIDEPTTEDIEIFFSILEVIDRATPGETPRMLEKRLKDVIKSSKDERDRLIEILASIGVVVPKSYDRKIPMKSDWDYAEYWRGEDKYNKENVEELFGQYIH